ncbi:MAG: plastocyanin/azurin family copper-binding protein [Betaproteobacteria bacterium]|nr:plastocyanin/azurin family copper-binding protein [Betaproteobacteria bacterium]
MKRNRTVCAGIAVLMIAGLFPLHAHAKADVFSFGHPGTAAKADRTIRIAALDTLRFVPSVVKVREGETVRFVVTNKGKLMHEFVLGDKREQMAHEAEMKRMAAMGMTMGRDPNGVPLAPGKTQTLIWTFADKPGTLYYACHEPGHYAGGMVGTILVEPAAHTSKG